MHPTGFQIDKPYSVPENLQPNTQYAKILLNSYSSNTSELSAILQYVYHHMVLDEKYPDIAAAMRSVSIVEMHHLEMLGNCIANLGVDPKFGYLRHNMLTCWNSSFVNYGTTLRERLYIDIQSEKNAIRQYQKTITLIDEPQIQKLIHRIIEDEELHLSIFTGLAKKYL